MPPSIYSIVHWSWIYSGILHTKESQSIIEQKKHGPLPSPSLQVVVMTVSWNYELIICHNILYNDVWDTVLLQLPNDMVDASYSIPRSKCADMGWLSEYFDSYHKIQGQSMLGGLGWISMIFVSPCASFFLWHASGLGHNFIKVFKIIVPKRLLSTYVCTHCYSPLKFLHLELGRQWKVTIFYTFCVKRRICIFNTKYLNGNDTRKLRTKTCDGYF
jgi:hypothetical protein